MCKRRNDDPLLSEFAKNGFWPLWTPQTDLPLGSLYVPTDSGTLTSIGSICDIVAGRMSLPDVEESQLKLEAGRTSNGVDTNAGGSFIAGLLGAMGLTGLSKLTANLKKNKVSSLEFRYEGATKRYLSAAKLADRLTGKTFDTGNPILRSQRRAAQFYVNWSTVYVKSISVRAKTASTIETDLDAAANELAKLGAKLNSQKQSDRFVRYRSDREIAIAVQLMRIEPQLVNDTIEVSLPRVETRVRGNSDEGFFGLGDEDDLFVHLD